MFDIAAIGNGLVGPGREVSEVTPSRLGTPDRGGRSLDRPLSRTADRVEVSEHASFMARLNGMPAIRWDRVEAVRAAVQDPAYLDRHLDEAIDELISDLS